MATTKTFGCSIKWNSKIDWKVKEVESHPETGEPWPPMPEFLLKAWQDLSGYVHPPEACLVNIYGPAARMGQHQDRDEADLSAPVVSLSLNHRLMAAKPAGFV